MSNTLFPSKLVTQKCRKKRNLLKYASENRNEGTFNDITVHVQDLYIQACRLVLACHSKFFEVMFKTNMKEKYGHDVEIQGICGKAVKAIVDYFYTESIDINGEIVLELLAASDFLQVDDVKEFCFEFLKANISLQNVIAVWKAVDLYQTETFQNWMDQYFTINLDKIAKTDEFKCLSKLDFVSCLAKGKEAKESSKYKALISWVKHDEEMRKTDFGELIEQVLDLSRISTEFIQDELLQEPLIISNPSCHQHVLTVFSKLLQNKSNDSIRANQTKVVALGGVRTSQKVNDVYNVQGQGLMNYPDLPVPLHSHSCLELNGYVFCIGGEAKTGKESFNCVWKLNLKSTEPEWEKIASMEKKRCDMGAAVYQSLLIVVGGRESTNLDSVEAYDAAADKWKTISSTQQHRANHALVSCKGTLYALGGMLKDVLSSTEKLEDLNGKWKAAKSMQKPRSMFAAVSCNDQLYAIGGICSPRKQSAIKSVEKYNPAANKWSYVKDMNFERYGHSACVLNGKIIVVGGLNANGKFISKIECYDPSYNAWSVIGAIGEPLYFHSAIAL